MTAQVETGHRLSNKNSAVILSTLTRYRPALASTCACERNPPASFKISDEGLSIVLVAFGKKSRHMLCVLWRTQVKFILMQMPRLFVARARGEGQRDRVILVAHSGQCWLQLLDCARQQRITAHASCVLASASENSLCTCMWMPKHES